MVGATFVPKTYRAAFVRDVSVGLGLGLAAAVGFRVYANRVQTRTRDYYVQFQKQYYNKQ